MSRLKNTLAEDLIAAKKDIERLSEHNLRLNKEKEELTKERGNLVVDLTGTERDNQSLSTVKPRLFLFSVENSFRFSFSSDHQRSSCRVSRSFHFVHVDVFRFFQGKKVLKIISTKHRICSVNSKSNANS